MDSSLRYGLKDFPGSSHDLILRLLAAHGRGLRILELGTADGFLTRLLVQQGHRVVGVESDPSAAREAQAFCETLYCGDIEGLDLPPCQPFDCVLLADVLEHLREPPAVLSRLRSLLAPGGDILISVPNVAHLTVRLGLLLGRFQYADRGILDRGHLRFFTLGSLLAMLRECGFVPVRVRATPAPLQIVFPITRHAAFLPVHRLHMAAAAWWKTLLAYQFVVVAQPVSGGTEDADRPARARR